MENGSLGHGIELETPGQGQSRGVKAMNLACVVGERRLVTIAAARHGMVTASVASAAQANLAQVGARILARVHDSNRATDLAIALPRPGHRPDKSRCVEHAAQEDHSALATNYLSRALAKCAEAMQAFERAGTGEKVHDQPKGEKDRT